MYKYYKVYTGKYPDRNGRLDISEALKEINDNGEEIVNVAPVGENSLYLIIITQTSLRSI